MKPDYYSVPEFAALKSVSRQAVYLLITKGELDTKKLYGKTLIVNNAKAQSYIKQPGRRSDLKDPHS